MIAGPALSFWRFSLPDAVVRRSSAGCRAAILRAARARIRAVGARSLHRSAKNILNQNDAIKQTGEEGCLDPALAFDDTDYDLAEVTSTLNLAEKHQGRDATVVATFQVLKDPHRMEWKLKLIDGGWKVADLVSMSGDWALSQFNCE